MEGRLSFSFGRYGTGRPAHIADLAELVALLAQSVERRTRGEWDRDRTTREWLIRAFTDLVDLYSKAEVTSSPPSVGVPSKSPRHRDDPATQAELAAAYARVGEITEQVGARASALEALERARAIRETLMTADPSAAGPLRNLANVLETIGILQSRTSGREAQALPTLERALALRETVAAVRPDSADDRAAVAATLRCMGNSLFPLGRAAQALRYLERARAIVGDHYRELTAPGLIRLREHPLFRPDFQLEEFIAVAGEIFPRPE